MIRRNAVLSLAVVVSMLLGTAGVARACPNCKEAVSLQSGDAANQADGYNWSVLFMISVPFSMAGTGALAIRRAVKRGALPEM